MGEDPPLFASLTPQYTLCGHSLFEESLKCAALLGEVATLNFSWWWRWWLWRVGLRPSLALGECDECEEEVWVDERGGDRVRGGDLEEVRVRGGLLEVLLLDLIMVRWFHAKAARCRSLKTSHNSQNTRIK